MTTTHAVGFRQYGDTSVLESLERPLPVLASDSVKIRVIAAGVNPADWRIRAGQFRLFIRNLPFVPGNDVAGIVEEIGTQVTSFRPGDAVYAMLPIALGGGYARHAVVPQSAVAHKPAPLSFAQAAAIPLTALTAFQGLRDYAGLQTGMRTLIYGASGGVGMFAVQIARQMGANVTAVTSGKNVEWVRQLGAEMVRDYTREDVTTGDEVYDVIFDTIGAHGINRWRRALRRGGILVSIDPIGANPLARLQAATAGRRITAFIVRPSSTDLRLLNAWFTAGSIRPMIDRCYPLTPAGAAEAQTYSASGRVRGKLVLIADETHASNTN